LFNGAKDGKPQCTIFAVFEVKKGNLVYMLTMEQQGAVKEILSAALSESRPAEALMVEHCFDSSKDGATDGMLGFGFGPESTLALPVLLHLLKELAHSGAVEIAKHWGESLAHWFTGENAIALDGKVLDQFGRAVALRLEKNGISSQDAATISNVVIRTMVAKPTLVRALIKK
jgi:hypothetical protein